MKDFVAWKIMKSDRGWAIFGMYARGAWVQVLRGFRDPEMATAMMCSLNKHGAVMYDNTGCAI